MKQQGMKFGGVYTTFCFDKNGLLKWKDISKNLVVNSGISYLITGGWTPVVYIGLTSGTPVIAAADIMTSHAGWTEVVTYTEATRPAYIKTITGPNVSNTASKALFSINGAATVGGIFICTINTKATTTGTLVSAAAFGTGNKSVINGDLIYIQYDFTATAV